MIRCSSCTSSHHADPGTVANSTIHIHNHLVKLGVTADDIVKKEYGIFDHRSLFDMHSRKEDGIFHLPLHNTAVVNQTVLN